MNSVYDVIIVGAGVSGTSLGYVLSKYTNVNKIKIIEKYSQAAQVNSNTHNNSQTLHFGDIETNYSLEKASRVKKAADLIKNYIEKYDPEKKIFSRYNKMVLGVGEDQTEKLSQRYDEFKKLFPRLKKIDKSEIERLEPRVVEGRKKDEKIIALSSDEGYTIDYQKLAKSFLDNLDTKRVSISFNTLLKKIDKSNDVYEVDTGDSKILGKVVIIAAGAHSLLIAKSLGYGKEYSLLSVAGSFYFAPYALNGKVYTIQIDKLPFAAIHGDPEVHDQTKTRFGPTAKVLPMLERHKYKTIYEYFKTAGIDFAAIKSFVKILSDWAILSYILQQFIYDLPIIGKRLFIKEVRKIVPSLKLNELYLAKGYGGVRPQIVNKNTKKLDLGEAKIIGDKIIFNITPSPGASTCLKNAFEDSKRVVEFLGTDYRFDEIKFKKDLAS